MTSTNVSEGPHETTCLPSKAEKLVNEASRCNLPQERPTSGKRSARKGCAQQTRGHGGGISEAPSDTANGKLPSVHLRIEPEGTENAGPGQHCKLLVSPAGERLKPLSPHNRMQDDPITWKPTQPSAEQEVRMPELRRAVDPLVPSFFQQVPPEFGLQPPKLPTSEPESTLNVAQCLHADSLESADVSTGLDHYSWPQILDGPQYQPPELHSRESEFPERPPGLVILPFRNPFSISPKREPQEQHVASLQQPSEPGLLTILENAPPGLFPDPTAQQTTHAAPEASFQPNFSAQPGFLTDHEVLEQAFFQVQRSQLKLSLQPTHLLSPLEQYQQQFSQAEPIFSPPISFPRFAEQPLPSAYAPSCSTDFSFRYDRGVRPSFRGRRLHRSCSPAYLHISSERDLTRIESLCHILNTKVLTSHKLTF